MELGLKGKKVFISGSTAGIGFATAARFLKEGADVVINGRSIDSTKSAIQKLIEIEHVGSVSGMAFDFRASDGRSEFLSKLDDIDILINNVGIYTSQSFEKTSDEDWDDMFRVNVMSGVMLSRHILPSMLKKNWGRIIFVSSECAEIVPEDLIAYSATKATLHAVSRGLAQLCKSTSVTVNTVVPGSTMTEGAEQFLEGLAKDKGITIQQAEADFFTNIRTSSIVQRFLLPIEIADGIVFLASQNSSAINGSTLKLDGGSIGGTL